MIKISSESLEFVKVLVEAKRDGAAFDPTYKVVEMAFTAGSDPDANEWNAGTWETETLPHGEEKYFARCFVGPGGTVELDEGVYQVWVRINVIPEIPVLQAGKIRVI